MANDIELFKFEDKDVNVIVHENEPWFIGKDIMNVLGHSNPSKALADFVDDEDKKVVKYKEIKAYNDPLEALWNGQDYSDKTLVNESGLYSLIFGSRLEKAKQFKKWVTSEVLPSIRKNGGYIAGQNQMTPEELALAGMKALENIVAEQKRQLEAAKPAIEFTQRVADSSDCLDIQEFCAVLNIPGLGRTNMFSWLRENGYLMADNMPYRNYIESGHFKVKEGVYHTPFGDKPYTKTLITGKGQIYLTKKIEDEFGKEI